MLAAPLLVGALLDRPAWIHLALAAFWFSGYFAFSATALWLKTGRKARFRAPVLTYGALSAALGLLVAALQPGLLRWAPVFLVPLSVGLVASARRRERALVAGLATTVGSALMTVVAYEAGPGTDYVASWRAATVLALYFAGTVLYVKTVIRERDDPRYLRASVGYHVVALAVVLVLGLITGFGGPLLPLVFVGFLARSWLVPPRRPRPRPVGIGEILGTLVLILVLVLG